MPIPVFGHVHFASYFIPAAAGIKRFSVLGRAMRTLTALCVLACVNIAAQYILGLLNVKNYFITEYYSVLEVSLLCAVFYFSIAFRGARRVLKTLGVMFVGIWAADRVWLYDADHINSGMAIVSRIFLILMSLVTLQAAMKDERSHLTERPVFWVVIGAILYSAGTLVVVGLSNQLLQLGESYFVAAWHINWALLITANLFYTKGMLCKSQA